MSCELEIKYTITMHKSIDRILACMDKLLLQEDVVIDTYLSFEYEVIRLLSGTRVITLNCCSYLDLTQAYIIELDTEKNVKIFVFKNRVDRDLYILNTYWKIPSNKTIVNSYANMLSIIKQEYKNIHVWYRKYLEFRDDLDRSILYFDNKCYNRHVNGYKVNLLIKSIVDDCNDFIYKVDKDRYLLKVEINKYVEVIISNYDMYISNSVQNIPDSEVLEYSNSLDYILCNVVDNKELFKQDVCKKLKPIIRHNRITQGYDLIANRHGDILMGQLEFGE